MADNGRFDRNARVSRFLASEVTQLPQHAGEMALLSAPRDALKAYCAMQCAVKALTEMSTCRHLPFIVVASGLHLPELAARRDPRHCSESFGRKARHDPANREPVSSLPVPFRACGHRPIRAKLPRTGKNDPAELGELGLLSSHDGRMAANNAAIEARRGEEAPCAGCNPTARPSPMLEPERVRRTS